jgi:UDP-galactopyranose mutase
LEVDRRPRRRDPNRFDSTERGCARVSYDYLVVGAGFAGSVLAERLAADAGRRVLLIDRRTHVGGNAYDEHDAAGILVHRYGPHVFHTNAPEVYAYLSRFTRWRPYEHRVLASVDGQLLPLPINLDTVNRLYGLELDSAGLGAFFAARAERIAPIRTSEDLVVSRIGRELYETFFRGYTRKQWGLDPAQLDASVAARIPLRTGRDDRYFDDAIQAMPQAGYTRLFENMLDRPNITLRLGVDYRDIGSSLRFDEIVYTGPIDEFFEQRFGPLPYRSLHFEHRTFDVERRQPAAVVNFPQDEPYTRVTEYKHLTGQTHPQTSVSFEYARAAGEPYYPIPRPVNAALYARYRALAEATPGVRFVGRLATYRYLNMDQVVAQALATYAKIRGAPSWTHVA